MMTAQEAFPPSKRITMFTTSSGRQAIFLEENELVQPKIPVSLKYYILAYDTMHYFSLQDSFLLIRYYHHDIQVHYQTHRLHR